MWFAREVISLAPCQFNILFLEEKKKEKNLRKYQLLCMERYALKKKKQLKQKHLYVVFQRPSASVCKNLRPSAPSGFPCGLWCVGESRTYSGLQQALWVSQVHLTEPGTMVPFCPLPTHAC